MEVSPVLLAVPYEKDVKDTLLFSEIWANGGRISRTIPEDEEVLWILGKAGSGAGATLEVFLPPLLLLFLSTGGTDGEEKQFFSGDAGAILNLLRTALLFYCSVANGDGI